MHPLRGMVGDYADPKWRVLIVNRIEGGGRLFEGLSGICSSCQLFIAQWLRGLQPEQPDQAN
jgi:hypothetical protein